MKDQREGVDGSHRRQRAGTSEQTRMKGGSRPGDIWGKNLPGRGNSKSTAVIRG